MTKRSIITIALASFITGIILIAKYINNENLGWFVLDSREVFINQNQEYNQELPKGEKYSFGIHSRYTNLGIVNIRFQTHGRINNDVLEFRIKE